MFVMAVEDGEKGSVMWWVQMGALRQAKSCQ